jgi:hypothetical protein
MHLCMNEPSPAAPCPVEAATAALDAARADLEEAQARLGAVRGEHAASQREVERLADAVAGGGDERVRRELAKAGELATTRAALVGAHERRVAEAAGRALAAEQALAEAERQAHQAAVDEAVTEARRLGEELDRDVEALADKARLLLAAGAKLVDLLGPGLGWDCRLTLLSAFTLGRRIAKSVEWHVEPPDGRPRSDLGAAYSDPERLAVLTSRGLENWFPGDLSPAVAAEAASVPPSTFLPDPIDHATVARLLPRSIADIDAGRQRPQAVAAGSSAKLY